MGKVWFITGASSGIGLAVGRAALAAGHRVVASSRSIAKLEAAYTGYSTDALLLVDLDVRDAQAARRATSSAVRAFGSLDLLVNNAGYSLMGTMESYSTNQIAEQMQTNFMGVVHMLYAALPYMRQKRAGRIFNVSSVAGVLGSAGCSAYAASKFAIEGLSLSLAVEVRAFNILVTLVEPGLFRTDLLAPNSAVFGSNEVEGYQDPGEFKKAWSGYHSMQPGQPEKLARAILQLAELATPPKQFLAGADAIELARTDLKRRLAKLETYAELSRASS